MSDRAERLEREILVEEEQYVVSVASRGEETGYGLLYYRRSGEATDRGDRRALLIPGTDPSALDDAELRELYASGSPLTATERRFTAPDGRPWLAQNRGPVWADDGAEGHSSVLFTSLGGPFERFETVGGHVGEMSDGELSELLAGHGEPR